MARQMMAAQELTLPAQIELLKGCFEGSCEATLPLQGQEVWPAESCSGALET